MIRLLRGAEPKTLLKNKAKWLAALQNAVDEKARRKAESKYHKPSVKDALVEMCHGKCAYCESYILHIDYGDIEHFKPKSVYPDLTFQWSNLLLSCKVCNGREYKGSRFPDAVDGGPPVDPSVENPGDHLAFVYDRVAGIASVIYKTERGRITRELFGLDRPELRGYRSLAMKKLLVISKLADADEEAKALLIEAVASEAEYSAFAATLLSQ